MVLYYLFWVVFFLIARVWFLIYHAESSKLLTLETVYGVFSHGVLMDLSMAAYLSILPFLWVTLGNFINKSFFQGTIFSYTFTMLSLVTLIIVTDLEVFNIWNFRIDTTPIRYISSLKGVYFTVKSSPVIRLFLSFALLMGLAGVILYRFLSNKIYDWKHIKNFPFILYGLLMTVALIIPIRGGFKAQPLKQKSVYFSSNYFANVSALNAPWNLGFSILRKVSSNENPFFFFPKETLDEKITALFKSSKNTKSVLSTKSATPNILIISIENFSDKIFNYKIGETEVSPNLNKLKKESIFFDNFYATSERNDKTLVSILSGFPSQPQESVLDFPEKVRKLPLLSSDFYEKGYSTSFYYGGDADFIGIKPYLFVGNFEKILEGKDFTNLNDNSKSVDDTVIYREFLNDHAHITHKPFFSTVLTVSSHEPFKASNLKFSSSEDNSGYYNAIFEADQALGYFLEDAKKQVWWDNTLIIVVSNGGYKFPATDNKLEEFKVPMFWTGGVVENAKVINFPMSQTDLVSTLLAQIGLSHSKYFWSKDVFGENMKQWAFLTFNNGFGFINNQSQYLYDNVGEIIIKGGKLKEDKDLKSGKALLQKSYQKFLDF